jgi:hypothetical protein
VTGTVELRVRAFRYIRSDKVVESGIQAFEDLSKRELAEVHRDEPVQAE